MLPVETVMKINQVRINLNYVDYVIIVRVTL